MQHSVSSNFTNKTAHWLLSDPFDPKPRLVDGRQPPWTHNFLFLYFICSPESRCHRRRGALGSSQGGAGGGWRVEGRWRAQRGPFWVAAHLLFGNTSNGARLPRLDETAFTVGVGFCLFFLSFFFIFCSVLPESIKAIYCNSRRQTSLLVLPPQTALPPPLRCRWVCQMLWVHLSSSSSFSSSFTNPTTPPLLVVRLKPWKCRDNPNPVWWIIWKTQRAGSALRVGSFFFFSRGQASEKTKQKPGRAWRETERTSFSPRSPFKSDSQRVEITLCTPVSRRKLFFFFMWLFPFLRRRSCLKVFAVLHQGHLKTMEPGTVFVTNYKVFVLGFCPSNQVQILCLCYFSLIACLFVWWLFTFTPYICTQGSIYSTSYNEKTRWLLLYLKVISFFFFNSCCGLK